MPLRKSQLYSSPWKSCDELRGGMDASQYKDYILTLLFMKYASDKYAGSDDSADITLPPGGASRDSDFRANRARRAAVRHGRVPLLFSAKVDTLKEVPNDPAPATTAPTCSREVLREQDTVWSVCCVLDTCLPVYQCHGHSFLPPTLKPICCAPQFLLVLQDIADILQESCQHNPNVCCLL